MKCIKSPTGIGYGGICSVLTEDDDNRSMPEMYDVFDVVLDLIDEYCGLVESLE